MKKTKYYIEIYSREIDEYILQSKWFDEKEQAINWAKSIEYVDGDVDVCLMKSEFENDEIYGDIELEAFLKEVGD